MDMLKSIIKWTLLIVLILLAACTQDNKKLSIEEATYEIVDTLRATDYETVYEEWFSEDLQNSISLAQLKNDWEERAHGNGEFLEVHSLKVENRADNLDIVEAKVEYTDLLFGIRLIFNENRILLGFNLSNALVNLSIPDTIIEEEITVGQGTDYELAGLLTLPKDRQDKLPALVLVHGSGPSDRDESAYAYKPFRDIAWGLAQQGIAVIRYDKRTYVYGEKMLQDNINLTVNEETIEDAIRASEILQNDHRVDENQVYLAGHSLGGMLAPRIDAQGGDYAGLIILAGTTRSLWEIVYDQNLYFLDQQTIDEKEKQEYLEMIEEEYNKGVELKEMTLEEAKDISIFGIDAYYLREMEEYDTSSLIQNLDKPIIVLQGKDDFQVYYEKDFAIYKDLLEDKEKARSISYENLNHFFVDYQGQDKGSLKEYDHPGRVSQEVIEDIGNWILENQE